MFSYGALKNFQTNIPFLIRFMNRETILLVLQRLLNSRLEPRIRVILFLFFLDEVIFFTS